MKNAFVIISILVILINTSCRKDIGNPPIPSTPVVTPVPFVEYRNSFCGTYTGTMICITQTVSQGYQGYPGYVFNDTTVIINTSNISKSLSNDSTLIVTDPSADYHSLNFKIRSTGSYSYHYPPFAQGPSYEVRSYSIRFANDSVFISVNSIRDVTYRTVQAYSTTYFTGKKQ